MEGQSLSSIASSFEFTSTRAVGSQVLQSPRKVISVPHYLREERLHSPSCFCVLFPCLPQFPSLHSATHIPSHRASHYLQEAPFDDHHFPQLSSTENLPMFSVFPMHQASATLFNLHVNYPTSSGEAHSLRREGTPSGHNGRSL